MRCDRAVLSAAAILACLAAGVSEVVAAEPGRMMTVYLVLLKKGPAWTADVTPATQAIQDAHMANIRAMWQAHKLVVAGPVEDQADLRGLFVFQAASLDEAKEWAASDPAVKAGRLVPVVYPWWVEKDALPDAGSYCTPPPFAASETRAGGQASATGHSQEKACAWPAALDAPTAAPRNHRVVFENDRVRVLDVVVEAGEREPLHAHCWPSILFVMFRGKLRERDADGKVIREVDTTPPASAFPQTQWLEASPPHSLENLDSQAIHLLRIELKE
ncbi:MAG TPA: YciI family protein [Vicinamibacteria bacterium]|nr:YciI family protein [Vicinamibacteria bacterium]